MATGPVRHAGFSPTPPVFFEPLPPNTRCRCMKMWVAYRPDSPDPITAHYFCCGNGEERYVVTDEGREYPSRPAAEPTADESTPDNGAYKLEEPTPGATMIKLVDLINSIEAPQPREDLVKLLLGVGYQVVAAKAGGFEVDVTVTASVRP